MGHHKQQLTRPLHAGLARLEYRGYDSAGLAIDGDKKNEVFAVKEVGKVASLKKLVDEQNFDLEKVFDSHAGIAHTRWATHGPPSRVNCHPHRYAPTMPHNNVLGQQVEAWTSGTSVYAVISTKFHQLKERG